MKISISEIIKTDGASIDIEFNQPIEELNSLTDHFIFNGPVSFTGKLVNISGILKLDGHLKAEYITKCYRCLEEVKGTIDIDIKENFLDSEKSTDIEAYTYVGNEIIIDKVFKDNIILNLPMKQVCKDDCKGLCPRCGLNLNYNTCDCKDDEINPGMEVLKKFFKN